ncbi:hypothetical protein A9264_01355 [Vibrio sp. UCD-FRSSP16_10]|uniref:DUF6701 domain-containing protein n=1 Tax=unclassified Vibrio TaxID=2614977 RepID=UPI0007FF93F7|nr:MULTISPECIES: DUF6701 domain-containing protein [unclassified Vibrio]OBT17437.1 hypothetical protein A9260_02805 [Vibrio sp. UCD-FRSSP16_30]OBT23206.1 hypothetical protein A9264_01355 [Vibrio sp. UCD-FRSSP16_10]
MGLLQRILSFWGLLCLVCLSASVSADDFTQGKCSNLNHNHGFSITFTVPNPKETTVKLTANHFTSILWTSDGSIAAEITDTTVDPGDKVLLIYSPTQANGKEGDLIYKLSNGTDFIEQERKSIEVEGGNGKLLVEGDPATVECGEVDDVPILTPNYCALFPEPLQSWTGVQSSLNITNSTARITGWSDEYKTKYLKRVSEGYQLSDPDTYTSIDEFLLLGFDQTGEYYHIYNFPICAGVSCDVGNTDGELESRKVDGGNVLPIPEKSPTGSLTINGGDEIAQNCGSTSTICSYQENGSDVNVTIKSDLATFKIYKLLDSKYDHVSITFQNGIYISNFQVGSGGPDGSLNLVFPEDANVTFDSFDHTNGSLGYDFQPNVRINVRTSIDFSTSVATTSGSSYPIIYVPQGSVTFHTAGSVFKGYILADLFSMSSSSVIEGAVTARQANFNNSPQIRKPDGNVCSTPPPSNLISSIEIQPNNYHLTCEDSNSVYVVPYDQNGQPMSDVGTESVSLTVPGVSVSGGAFDSANQRFVFNIDSRDNNEYGDVLATAEVVGSSASDQENISFVPYKFDIKPSSDLTWGGQDLEAFAGELKNIDVRVLGCTNNSSPAPVVINYDKTLSASNALTYILQRPSSGGTGQLSSADYSFSGGEVSNVGVNFDNSGQLLVTLEDSSFQCTPNVANIINCPSDGGTLKGQFTFKTRPWKIALCNIQSNGRTNPAGGSTGNGFIASGEPFSVDYRPIVHPDSANGNSDECGYPITSNYALDNGPLELSYNVVYPTNTNVNQGSMTPDLTVVPPFNSTDTNGIKTLDHTWSEAGSIELTSQATYLSMVVDPDSQMIGRFYPDYFTILNNSWDDPTGQSFTYMNQKFAKVTAEVGAFNTLGGATNNYGEFLPEHKASFEFDEDRLSNSGPQDLASNASYSGNIWRLDSDEISWMKLFDFTPDGPFNFAGGAEKKVSLKVTSATATDTAQFKQDRGDASGITTQQLPDEDPRVVFGRVNLSDVGGVEGTSITVPLQVQYWKNGMFVNNEFDSFSLINAEMDGNPTVIWPVGGSTTVTLEGTADVNNGVANSGLVAKQSVAAREQVKITQQLNSLTNEMPWLMFDWDQNKTDEENPSTIVTFGINRGNDRVIFRGEPGL